ncbi:hypothetical protein Syn7803C67_8 [Synechococcus phage ACG-2014b]|uniref:Uncharacterized protein n=1 Tax=Synechococcus phage ACG-2014b TaxID=1493508 RepID=A0A0E3EY15_9CAUD|nr:hypothetical protein Syn7803C67_8 [Synechococcus phage ACG-2014b]
MANITAYKLVSPEVSQKSTVVNAINLNTYAVNNLGVAVTSIANTIGDLRGINTEKSKIDKKNLLIERRQERLEKDKQAENSEEISKGKPNKKDESKLKLGLKKTTKGAFGWLQNFLGPLGSLLLDLGAFALTKKVLDYFSDEENQIKIKTFLERSQFVFDKISELSGDITSKVSDGLDFIFGKETTIEQRLEAFGKIALAIGGMGAILLAANALPFGRDRDLNRNRNRNNNARNAQRGTNAFQSGARSFSRPAGFMPRSDAAGNQIAGRGSLYRQNLNRVVRPGQLTSGLTQPARPSRMAGFRANLQTGTANVPLSPGLQRAAFKAGPRAAKIARASSAAAKNAMGRIPFIGALIAGIYTYFEDIDPLDGKPDRNLSKALFVAGGTALGGLLGSFIPIPILGTALGAILGEYVGELMYILIKGDGPGAVGAKLKKDIQKLFEAGKLFVGWAGDGFSRLLDGFPKMNIFGQKVPDPFFMINPMNMLDKAKLIGKAFFSRDTMNLDDKKVGEKVTIDGQEKYFAGDDYGFQSLEAYNKLVKDGVLPHPAGEAPPIGKSSGGLVQPQQMFLGGVVKGIGNAIKGVTGGIGKAVGSVVNNPIVRSVASFIPGAAPIMAGIGMASNIMQGNFNMGDILGAAGSFIPGFGAAMSSPLGQIGQSILSGNYMGAMDQGLSMVTSSLGIPSAISGIAKAAITGGDMSAGIAETAAQVGVDPKIIGAVSRGNDALSQGGLSERYVMQEAIEFLPVPIVIKEFQLIPQAVPINNSSSNAVHSGTSTLTQRMQ